MIEILEERKKKRKKKAKRGLWDNIWARRRAGKRPKRPGEKGYPKTLDIESVQREQLKEFIVETIMSL